MDAIGGYRLVRGLGEGARAMVHLARAEGDDAPVVVKHYRPEVDAESIGIEIEALARAVGEHVVALLDVATAPSRQLALILARIPGGSLSRLLAHRTVLTRGEAVGILATLGEALDAIHAAGVVHGGIRAEAVLFDDDGVPVLACFGRASLIAPGLPPALLELEPGPASDQHAFAVLARTVLDRVDDREGVARVLEHLAASGTAGWGRRVAGSLRELADPAPVDLRVSAPVTGVSPIPGRLELAASAPAARVRRRAEAPRTSAVTDVLAGILDARHISAVAGSLRTVRLRVWLLAGTALIALVAALVLVPNGAGTPEAAPVPTATTATPTAAPIPADEDPVDALIRLLELRQRCMQDRSVLCLDEVAQAGSAALDDDRALVLSLQAGAETPDELSVEARQVTITEELGDAVLLSIATDGQPWAVLLTRSEAGWLIRDYLEG